MHDQHGKQFVLHPTANQFEPIKEVYRFGQLFA
jgi:hypothetical protein